MTMARYQFTVVDEAGNVVPNAHIEVRREQPGQPLAALKSNRAGSAALTNPFDADDDGFVGFHVSGGAFQIRAYTGASGAPTFERIWRYVAIGLAAETDAVVSNDFDTKADVEIADVNLDENYVRIAGYYAAGDGGGALYKRVFSEPAHEGKIQSNDGAWWEIAETNINVKMFGARGDGSTPDEDALNAALAYASANLVSVFVPSSIFGYAVDDRIIIPDGVTLCGEGQFSSAIRAKATFNSAHGAVVWPGHNSKIIDISIDANNLTTAGPILCASIVGAKIINVLAMNGLHGVALSNSTYCFIENLEVSGNQNRGLIIDPNSAYNTVQGLYSHDNETAGFLIGHASHHNVVTNFRIEDTGNSPIWIHNEAYSNVVSDGTAKNLGSGQTGLILMSNAYSNVVSNIELDGYDFGILLRAGAVDATYNGGDTRDNIVTDIRLTGPGSGTSGSIGVKFESTDSGAHKATRNTLTEILISGYAKGFAAVTGGATDTNANVIALCDVRNDVTTPWDMNGAATLGGNVIAGLAGYAASNILVNGALDTDGTLAANSDAKIATQKAVKTYVDQIIATTDAMVFKGVIDCSANPNYPAADRGWTYRVSVAGKIGGASGVNVEAGDILICLTDGTAAGNQATVGAAWGVVQVNIDGAVTLSGAQTLLNKTMSGADNTFSAIPQAAVSNLGLVMISTQVAADSATIDFTGLDDTYDAYVLKVTSAKPATDDVEVWLRVGTGGTPTYQASTYEYTNNINNQGGSQFFAAAGSAAKMVLSGAAGYGQSVGNASGEHWSGTIEFENPEAADFQLFSWKTRWNRPDGIPNFAAGGGAYSSAAAITAIRFMFSSGNIASGRFTLYGHRKVV